MSRKLYPALEVLCVAALIAFITFLVLSRSGGTDKPVGDVAAPAVKLLEEGQMDKKTNADAAKAFGFDLSKTDGLVYYENSDIMDVSGLLVVKVKDRKRSVRRWRSISPTRKTCTKTTRRNSTRCSRTAFSK